MTAAGSTETNAAERGDMTRRFTQMHGCGNDFVLIEDFADAVVLSALDSVAWTFNVRGTDVAHTPVALGYAIVHADGTADLFAAPDKIGEGVRRHLGNAVAVRRARSAPRTILVTGSLSRARRVAWPSSARPRASSASTSATTPSPWERPRRTSSATSSLASLRVTWPRAAASSAMSGR